MSSPATGGHCDWEAQGRGPGSAGRARRRGLSDRGDLYSCRAAAESGSRPGCPGHAATSPGQSRPRREAPHLKPAAESRYHRLVRHDPCRSLRRPASCHGHAADKQAHGKEKMTRSSSGVWPSQARPAHDPVRRLAGDLTTTEAGIKIPATPVAFYGRTACAAGSGDSQADRYRQLVLCRAVVANCAWPSASGSWPRGPRHNVRAASGKPGRGEPR